MKQKVSVMNLNATLIKGKNLKEPMVLFPLSQYQKLMEYIEDIEDRMSVKQCENEPVFDFKQLLKKLDKKKGFNRKL
ncbi:MAG: hypothetical protein HY738_24375 [Bacteroidia bacterium]|nr:hypothetical protein [Bacteroidia bacterium]